MIMIIVLIIIIIILIIIISILKEDNVFSMIAILQYGPLMNTDVETDFFKKKL